MALLATPWSIGQHCVTQATWWWTSATHDTPARRCQKNFSISSSLLSQAKKLIHCFTELSDINVIRTSVLIEGASSWDLIVQEEKNEEDAGHKEYQYETTPSLPPPLMTLIKERKPTLKPNSIQSYYLYSRRLINPSWLRCWLRGKRGDLWWILGWSFHHYETVWVLLGLLKIVRKSQGCCNRNGKKGVLTWKVIFNASHGVNTNW